MVRRWMIRRSILKKLREVAREHRGKANAFMRVARSSKSEDEYWEYKLRALENRDFADELDALVDIFVLW